MSYLSRSIKKFIIPSLMLLLLLTTALTVFCFVTVKNTAVCNRIEIWIDIMTISASCSIEPESLRSESIGLWDFPLPSVALES